MKTACLTAVAKQAFAFAACLLGTCSMVWGQNDWTVISTAGDPDPVTTFDLADPSGSQVQIGNVATNFNRGMDYFGVDSFYYFVSTDALNDPGQRGLWSWVGGTNTQLATIGFSDSGDGDATFDFATNQFFIAVDDQDGMGGDSLYVWDDLDGTPSFTEIGETGLSQLIGIAVDPNSGAIFGYDSDTEALYNIDRTDGSTTLVGASGLSLGAVGGMDFSLDGSTLLLSSGDDLFLVDSSNGSLTAAGTLNGLNTSALATNVIPEPSSLMVLAACSLLVTRRRR